MLVCVDVTWRESWLMHLIVGVLECLEDFDVLACSANATVPFQVHPGCGLKRGQQLAGFSEKCAARLLRPLVRMHLAGVGKLLTGLMLMSIAFSLGLSRSGCTVHDLGFSAITFFGCALQQLEVLNSH